MTVVGTARGTQLVRKLLQRNRSTLLPFLPPEVHRGERLGRSADVYMFGLLMWELYTGGVAFTNLAGGHGTSLGAVLYSSPLVHGPRPPSNTMLPPEAYSLQAGSRSNLTNTRTMQWQQQQQPNP